MTQSLLLPTGRFEKILVASDGSEFTHSAEKIAMALAGLMGANLIFMRMVGTGVTESGSEGGGQEFFVQREAEAHADLLTLTEEAARQGVVCESLVRNGGAPHDEILAAAQQVQADLIIMGRRGKRGLARLMLGDATERVVAQGRCQVMVVPRMTDMWTTRILLATDGSRYSDEASVTACMLAKLSDIPLLVMTACTDEGSGNWCQEAEKLVADVLEYARAQGVQGEGAIVEGPPAQSILETAAKRRVGLIVGGSHGRSGLKKTFMGSVMEQVISQAICPVLTVKG